MMKKKNLFLLAACTFTLILGSCSDDVMDNIQPEDDSNHQTRGEENTNWSRAYVLCEGTWKATPPSLPGKVTWYDNTWKKISSVEVGDTGNDLIKYGSKLYCAVSGHDLTADNGGIWVFDATTGEVRGKQLQYDDPKSGHKIMPRHLAAANGKVYISLYSGGVISIDTINYALQKSAALKATYSEGICVANNKVYVCNSGNVGDTAAGEGTTISILSLDLTGEKLITVPQNPKLIAQRENGEIYFNVLGQYAMNSALYNLNNTSSPIAKQASSFTIGKKAIYTTDVDWTSYDTKLWKVLFDGATTTFTKAPEFMLGYSVSVNPYNEDVCFGQMGQNLYVYKADGTGPVNTIATGTANVNSVVFVQ